MQKDCFICLGQTSDGKTGKWALANQNGALTQSWQVLTIPTLFHLVRLEARQRHFLKSDTFSYQLKNQAALECWAMGRNQLLYRSLWRLNGACLFEWSAYLPILKNEAASQKDWEIYRICRSLNGIWH